MAEEVDFAVGRDATRFDFADVVEEGAVANFQARDALGDDLLGVLPHVFVAPLAVAEADHGFDFGQERVEHARGEQGVEAGVGVLTHHDAVERGTDVFGIEACEIGGVDQHHGVIGHTAFAALRGALEGGSGTLSVGGRQRSLRRGRHAEVERVERAKRSNNEAQTGRPLYAQARKTQQERHAVAKMPILAQKTGPAKPGALGYGGARRPSARARAA